jgi:hypothetical protein
MMVHYSIEPVENSAAKLTARFGNPFCETLRRQQNSFAASRDTGREENIIPLLPSADIAPVHP